MIYLIFFIYVKEYLIEQINIKPIISQSNRAKFVINRPKIFHAVNVQVIRLSLHSGCKISPTQYKKIKKYNGGYSIGVWRSVSSGFTESV